MLPGPERLDAEALLLRLNLVLLVHLDRVTDELNVTHTRTVTLAQTQVLNPSEPGGEFFEAGH